jgi:hypothetical protein
MAISRERRVLLGLWCLAALSCILGVLARPSLGYETGGADQLLDLVRVLCATCLSLTLLLGPGLLWRAANGSRSPSLGFLPLPGLAVLIASGILAWVLASSVEPRLACFLVFGPLLGLLFGGMVGAGPDDLLDSEERRVLLIVGCTLGFAIARALWSLGPEGELYGGGISRTLEVGDRSDSRISNIIPQLVANGSSPYGPLGTSLFAPYNFSSRGPLAGLASTPIVLMSGGRPPAGLPEEAWLPFDPQGFMAYRLAMMTFASTAFLSLWDLTRRIGGRRAARVALLLAVTTPFLVHEIWFTWPKLLGASFVLLSGVAIVERKPFRSGLLVGIGYLMHPGALLSLSGLGLLALWPLKGASWRRPELKAAVLLVAGVSISLIAWRLANGSHYSQSGFTEYLHTAGSEAHPDLLHWLAYRGDSIANTFIPILPMFANSVSINVVGGTSPPVIHFFFQYWDGLPFGVGIVFFPLLLISLWRAWRLWQWPIFASIVAPFVAFAIYWGASRTGMLREGLQAWTLVLFAVVALQQAHAGFPWLRSRLIRAILSLRTVELLAIALGPALATNHVLISSRFAINDTVALVAMLAFAGGLAWLVWSTTPERLERADAD